MQLFPVPGPGDLRAAGAQRDPRSRGQHDGLCQCRWQWQWRGGSGTGSGGGDSGSGTRHVRVAVAVALVVRQWQLGSWRRLVAVGGEFPRRRLYVCGGVIFFRFFLPSAWQNETAAMGQSDK
jgi:hypothetical protein